MDRQIAEGNVFEGKTRLSIALAIVFLVVGAAFVFSTRLKNEPDSVTTLRTVTTIIWGLVLGALVLWATDGDTSPFDYWTIGHGMTGVVFGVWGTPGLLVLILTIGWEIIEVAGFSTREVILNRVVDVLAALAGWIVFGIILIPLFTSFGRPPILW